MKTYVVVHDTRYVYEHPASVSRQVLHLTPRATPWQTCSEHALAVKQMSAGGVKRHAGALRGTGIGKMHAYAGAQLIDIDRLGQIIDATGVQRPHHMFGLG